MSLSVIVITKNEESVIRRCLDSVRWADEIVVVDSGSTDRTVAICRDLGAKVTVTPDWPGFGPQKNRALELATGEWVLSIDADEWVPPGLAQELRSAIAQPGGRVAFELPRLSTFCGRFMRHSGWWPDYVPRLFRRGSGRFSDDLVHERLVLDAPVGRLQAVLIHETLSTLEELLAKINDYSTAGAAMLHAKGRSASLTKAVLHAIWAFLRTYVFRAGFLDGREGFMVAVSTAEGVYYRYLKLMLLSRKQSVRGPE